MKEMNVCTKLKGLLDSNETVGDTVCIRVFAHAGRPDQHVV